ncbi:hypothetical protein SAMN02745975_02603 [Geosporobacter subterraneus DSM 17957]|uniref:Uncharacterized protein n=1 Tax=Geosporobacter subterraneus DSM 17957 TaxID=1121919 RepID=A0A1M6L6Q4_9FIRM|nr:hypothetical protein [Geosporobacter subterraneus]SHJ66918.1 hypothetical protein SAMN02745975_02603 [Geosporobacter subterraneus DSM 17957]
MDASLRHILVSKDKTLKLVDHYHAFTQKDPYPVKFLRQLEELGLLYQFLDHVLQLDEKLFSQWKKAMPNYFHNI